LEVGEALPDVGEAVGGVARVEVTQHDLAGPRARRGWTLVIPLVALAVIVLALLRTDQEIDRLSADQ